MLPFLQPKKLVSMVMSRQKPEGSTEDVGREGEPKPELVLAMERFISAVSMKDAASAADAFEEAMEACGNPMEEVIDR